jgi:hypothetical protein
MSPDEATIEPDNTTFHTKNRDNNSRQMDKGQKEYINIILC